MNRNAGEPARLLIIDDEPVVRPIIERFVRPLGFEVRYAERGADGLAQIARFQPHVAMVDLQMPELDGIDVLKAIKEADPECHVILMTGNATVDSAIEAVRAGALDYVSKPFDFDRLKSLLERVIETLSRREALMRADVEAAARLEYHGMIGRAAPMQRLFETIQRMAPHARTVLVTGETGTGKELVARALHRAGRRANRKFLTVNCSAVVETLFESELFGHVRGAFTGASETKVGMFEHADGGTLFLDEAGELPLSLQPKLLRAVEYGEIQRVGSLDTRRVDVTVIAATNRDLGSEVSAGRFRSDLFYRLGIIEVHVPPLRDRREDVPYLAASFIKEVAARVGRHIAGLTAQAEQLLMEARWPGNVRELRNVIERASILCDGGLLGERDIQTAMSPSRLTSMPERGAGRPALADEPTGLLSAAQRAQILKVLDETSGNKSEAARRLGISRRSMYRWIDRLQLDQ